MGEGPFVAVIQRKGVYLASSYFAFLRLIPNWIRVRVCCIHSESKKSMAGFNFTIPRYSQIKVCDGLGTVCYHHSVVKKLRFIWFGWFRFFGFLCPMGSWWSSRLSRLDIPPIWAWEWNSSWKRPEWSSEIRVCLWSKCSGVVTDTLTLFRWF